MKSLNENLEKILQSPTVAMADKVNLLKSQGKKIIGLQTGDPDFKTHPAIVEFATEQIIAGKTHYGASQGALHVREAIVEKLERDNGLFYDPKKEVILTHGGIHAFYLALQSIINKGDEFLIPDPTWATHANMATLLGGRAVRVMAPPANNFLPTFADWEKAITPKTKSVIINYPSNPTGVYPSREYLQELVDLCIKNDLTIISDEVYENLFFEEHPVSIASLPGAKERTLVINSLSKTYAMTGWRVGYLSGPEKVIQNALKASQHSITCVAPFIQEAAGYALSNPEIQQYAGEMRQGYKRRRDLVMRIAEREASSKVVCTAPMGAFYYFLDMRSLGISSSEICDRLLEEANVGTVAGSAFGTMGEGFLRMTIAASDQEVEQGFMEILKWAKNQ